MSDLPFDGLTLAERKVIARDVIQSFTPDTLPSAFRTAEYERITEGQEGRPRADLTIPDDFEATLLLRACYDPATFAMLTNLRPSDDLALAFEQKMARCFRDQREAYDALRDRCRSETTSELRAQVALICREYHTIVHEMGVDVTTRRQGRYHASEVLLAALADVCRRNDDLLPAPSRGHSSTDGAEDPIAGAPSLYRALIGDVSTHFMLDTLDLIRQQWPEDLARPETQSSMAKIVRLLHRNGAPEEYLMGLHVLCAP